MPRRKFAWAALPDEQLLGLRLKDLKVTVDGTWLEHFAENRAGWAISTGATSVSATLCATGRTLLDVCSDRMIAECNHSSPARNSKARRLRPSRPAFWVEKTRGHACHIRSATLATRELITPCPPLLSSRTR